MTTKPKISQQPAIIVDLPPLSPSRAHQSQYKPPKDAKKNQGWLNTTSVVVITLLVLAGGLGYYLSLMKKTGLGSAAVLTKEEFVDTDTGLRLKALHFDKLFGSETAKAVAFTACPIEGCSPVVPVDQLVNESTLGSEAALAYAHISRHLYLRKVVLKERGLIAYGIVYENPANATDNLQALIEEALLTDVQSVEQAGFSTFYLTNRANIGCYHLLLVSNNPAELAKFDFMKKAA